MPTAAANGRNDRNRLPPPKRGQIKAQIFESMRKTASSAASKAAGAFLGAIRKGSGSSASSASEDDNSLPPSGYNSDGNPNFP